MRIIGKSDGGFIVDMKEDELANLVGYFYMGQDKFPAFSVGQEVKVGDMYQQLYRMSYFKADILKAIDACNEAAKQLSPVAPLVGAIMAQEPSHAN